LASPFNDMSATFDPRRLDVAAFAQAEGRLDGEWPLAALTRLLQDALPLSADSPATVVAWSARGSRKAVTGGDPEIRLLLRAHTALQMSCQRCLQPVTVELDVQPRLRFVRGEQLAETLDEGSEDEDVLALTATLDLQALVEDERVPVVSATGSTASIRHASRACAADTVSINAPPAGAGTISSGTNPAGANSRRHLKSWLALRSCRRATAATEEPGSNVAATSSRFNSSDHRRRLSPACLVSACR